MKEFEFCQRRFKESYSKNLEPNKYYHYEPYRENGFLTKFGRYSIGGQIFDFLTKDLNETITRCLVDIEKQMNRSLSDPYEFQLRNFEAFIKDEELVFNSSRFLSKNNRPFKITRSEVNSLNHCLSIDVNKFTMKFGYYFFNKVIGYIENDGSLTESEFNAIKNVLDKIKEIYNGNVKGYEYNSFNVRTFAEARDLHIDYLKSLNADELETFNENLCELMNKGFIAVDLSEFIRHKMYSELFDLLTENLDETITRCLDDIETHLSESSTLPTELSFENRELVFSDFMDFRLKSHEINDIDIDCIFSWSADCINSDKELYEQVYQMEMQRIKAEKAKDIQEAIQVYQMEMQRIKAEKAETIQEAIQQEADVPQMEEKKQKRGRR